VTLIDNDIRALKTQLQAQRLAVQEALHQRLHQGDDPSELALANFSHTVEERAEADLLNDTDIAQLNLETAELDQIDAALARIDADTFGVCVGCGEPIADARLQAQPAAATCISCQQERERHG
jgi:DnaK suppressor protein